tara:strand:- start:385 stop:1053 length:669 start_codon:yes stop_codon:yes gene_type:complete
LKQLKGYVEEIDPKLGKNGQMWLLKFKFIDSDEGPVWMGAYADRKDAPKAFVQRVVAEAELPEGDRTTWEITANTVEEKGYENLYVTSAKSSSNGPEPVSLVTSSDDGTPVPTVGGRYLGDTPRAAFPNEKDSLIVAEVAIKEATSIAGVLMNANPKTFGQEYGTGNHVQVTGFTDAGLLDTVRGFTLDFAKIIVDTARALREVPAKEEPAKEDSLFDEEPL